MRNKLIPKIMLGIWSLFLCSALNAAGKSAGLFLTLPNDVRATGMGDAYGAAVSGPSGLWYNPAGLVRSEQGGLSLSHTDYLEGISYDSFGLAMPFGKGHAIGFGGQFLRVGAVSGYDNTGTASGSFSPQDTAFTLGYAKSLRATRLGVNLKQIQSKIEDSATTQAFDFGIQHDIKKFTFGLSSENHGGSLKYGSQSDPLPQRNRLSLNYRANVRNQFNLDYVMTDSEKAWTALGAETFLVKTNAISFALRAGYNTRTQGSIKGKQGYSFGTTFGVKSLQFHYAWVPFGELGVTNRLSLDFAFTNPFRREGSARLAESPFSNEFQSSYEAKKAALAYPTKPWSHQRFNKLKSDKDIEVTLSTTSVCDAQGPVASIASRSGLAFVQYRDLEENGWDWLRKNQILFSGDGVKTRSRGQVTLKFINGSSLDLEPGTILGFDDNASVCGDIRVTVQKGKVYVTSPNDRAIQIKTTFGDLNLKQGTADLFVNRKKIAIQQVHGKSELNEGNKTTAIAERTKFEKKRDKEASVKSVAGESETDNDSFEPEETDVVSADDGSSTGSAAVQLGRWDMGIIEQFRSRVQSVSEIPGIDIKEYIRDDKLREAVHMIIRDLTNLKQDLISQQDTYREDQREFETRKASLQSEKDHTPTDKREDWSLEYSEVSQALKSAKKSIIKMTNDIEGLDEEIRNSKKELAGISLARMMNISISNEALPFDRDYGVIPKESFSSLDQVAQFIRDLRPTRVMVQGLANEDLPASKRTKVSKKQAQLVSNYLAKKTGLPQKTFIIRGTEKSSGDDDAQVDIWVDWSGL